MWISPWISAGQSVQKQIVYFGSHFYPESILFQYRDYQAIYTGPKILIYR